MFNIDLPTALIIMGILFTVMFGSMGYVAITMPESDAIKSLRINKDKDN